MKAYMKNGMSIVLCLVLILGVVSSVGVRKSVAEENLQTYALFNGDYEQPAANGQIPGWGQYLGTSNGSVSLDNRAHTGSSSLNMTNGFIAMWNILDVNTQQANLPHPGDRVKAEVWVQIPAATDLSNPFEIWVEEVDASGNKHLIAKGALSSNVPKGEWTKLSTAPVDGGVINTSSQKIVVSYQNWVNGTILLDDLQLGATERGVVPPVDNQITKPKPYHLKNGSFENVALDEWGTYLSDGKLTLTTDDSYYGKKALEMKGTGKKDSLISMWQTIQLGTGADQPKAGDKVEAGAWVNIPQEAVPFHNGSMKLQVEGINNNGDKVLLAESTGDLSTLPKETWVYIMAQPVQDRSITSEMSGIVVSLQNPMKGRTLIDFVEAGPQYSLTGNPEKYAMIAYQPWYGSEKNWHNWQWTKGGGPGHDPNVIMGNDQRDIASFYYPLIGAYDSKDPDVLRYHVQLIKAMGIDCIQVNWYAALEPDFVKTFETLLDIAEESDMKVSVLYEPKIHLANWIPHSSFQEKIDAITQDIIDIDKNYGNRKAMLKVRGRTAVAIFGAVTTGLTSANWDQIVSTIQGKGYNPYMMGDVITSSSASFLPSYDSMFNWILYADELKNDNSDANAASFSERINKTTQNWMKGDPNKRLSVGIVWPGFNDSGVYGWGSGSSRVIPESSSFYTATWEGMLKNNFDWVLVATFNDWNESTIVEPSKQLGYSRAITTQNYIEKFKGLEPMDDGLFEKITKDYLARKGIIHYR